MGSDKEEIEREHSRSCPEMLCCEGEKAEIDVDGYSGEGEDKIDQIRF